MRVFVTGVVAAATSTLVWFCLVHTMHKDFGGFAVIVGLATGWGIYKAAGAHAGHAYWRGGLAAVLALAAIVGGRIGYAEWMRATAGQATAADRLVSLNKKSFEDADADATAGAPATSPPTASESTQRTTISDSFGATTPPDRQTKNVDLIWMSLAALLAYVVGSGKSEAVPGLQSEPTVSDSTGPLSTLEEDEN